MLRKLLIALAITTTALAAMPTDASARGGWRGGGGGHWHGGGYRGGYRGFYGPAFGLGLGIAAPYAYNNYGCYRTVRVATPYGIRWRRVWVCG